MIGKPATYGLPEQKIVFESGMERSSAEGKVNWALTADGPMLERWAKHLTKGAETHEPRNWMLANGDPEFQRFRESAYRHFMQWYRGDADEDHAAAVFFNVNGAEYSRVEREESEEVQILRQDLEYANERIQQLLVPDFNEPAPHLQDGGW